jgi:hypothetical protein
VRVGSKIVECAPAPVGLFRQVAETGRGPMLGWMPAQECPKTEFCLRRRPFFSCNENCATRDCDVIGRAFPLRSLSAKTVISHSSPITSSARSSSRRSNVRLRAFD